MGTPIIPPIDPPDVPEGDDGLCWGLGQPFGDGPTPSIIYAKFSGILKGPNWVAARGEPLNGTYQLNQRLTDPDVYEAFLPLGVVVFVTFGGLTTGAGLSKSSYFHFFYFSGPKCDDFMENEENNWFVSGTLKLILPGVSP